MATEIPAQAPARRSTAPSLIRVPRGKLPPIMDDAHGGASAQKTTQILRPRATAWNPYRRDPVVGVGMGRMGSRRSAYGKGLAPLLADGNHRDAGRNRARCGAAGTAAHAGVIAPHFRMI